jgi:hypothetical protein
LLAATLYQGNPDRNHKFWNIRSTEIYILHAQELLECLLHINGKFTLGKLKSFLLDKQKIISFAEYFLVHATCHILVYVLGFYNIPNFLTISGLYSFSHTSPGTNSGE